MLVFGGMLAHLFKDLGVFHFKVNTNSSLKLDQDQVDIQNSGKILTTECSGVRNFSITLILISYSSKSLIFYRCPISNCQHCITAIIKWLIADLLSLKFQNDTEGLKNGSYYIQLSYVRTDQTSTNCQFFFFFLNKPIVI